MSDTVKIEITIRTDKVGSEVTRIVEFDREDWDEMDGWVKDKVLLEDEVNPMIEWSWKEVDD